MPVFPLVRKSILIPLFLIPALACMLTSCYNTKNLNYLQGSFDTARLSQIKLPETYIQTGDNLSITVYSDNSQATALYNQQGTVSPLGGMSSSSMSGAGGLSLGTSVSSGGNSGYLVDDQGYITFPGIGPLHVEGLTRTELKDTLDGRLKDYLKNPYYNIRFNNNRITILGEVGKPGVFPMPGDHVSLLEALSMAGDMTLYSRRDNILVIRENEGKRTFARLDITKPEIMESPYFYLQQNDVMLVEATKKKAIANDVITSRNVSIAATTLSIVLILITLFRKN